MKKRLLITSIVMMLVVAVALSTATYAWFTSNATVTANSITMTATTNAEDALGISWTDGNYGTSISPVITENLTFSPVTPQTLTVDTTTSAVVFKTQSAKSVNGDFIFNGAGVDATNASYTWADTGAAHTSFFVKNTSPSNTLNGNLRLRATITGDNAAVMRVGVFQKVSSDYVLKAVLANQVAATYTAVAENTVFADTPTVYYKKVLGKYVTATAGTATEVTAGVADYTVGAQAPAGKFFTSEATATHATAVYGDIGNGNSVNAMATVNCSEEVTFGALTAGQVIELKIIVWMDGAALGDAEQNKPATVLLDFDVANA